MTDTQAGSAVLVAVASKGNGQIDEHFGHADAFGIYEVASASVRFVGQRMVEHYCQGGYGDEDKRAVILRALADCVACFVARIGDGPRQQLADAGIEAVSDYACGAIEASLLAWFAGYRAPD